MKKISILKVLCLASLILLLLISFSQIDSNCQPYNNTNPAYEEDICNIISPSQNTPDNIFLLCLS